MRDRDLQLTVDGGSYAAVLAGLEDQRHINGVVSNGVVPTSQICKLVAKPAPDVFRIQRVYHNEARFQMTRVSNSSGAAAGGRGPARGPLQGDGRGHGAAVRPGQGAAPGHAGQGNETHHEISLSLSIYIYIYICIYISRTKV